MVAKSMFVQRRKLLLVDLQAKFSTDKVIVFLFSGFELDSRYRFRPENNFFYLTGVTEPGVVAMFTSGSDCQFFVPNYAIDRSAWESPDAKCENLLAASIILGQKIPGYAFDPNFSREMVENFVASLQHYQSQGFQVFSSFPADLSNAMATISASWFVARLKELFRELCGFTDCAEQIEEMRRVKDVFEITATQKSVDACIAAQIMAAQNLKAGNTENSVKHKIHAEFDAQGCGVLSFSSIVAAGKNATVLHHTPSNKILQNGELVVVDIGCESENYASDLTRTFPVGGKFSPRQLELYELVLAAQKYAESLAKPGVFLRGVQNSLHHKVVEFFREQGVEKYFLHGLGHYVGLDVHDVGTYQKPLEPGVIFTIEPGLYLAAEGVGIRIEDNYLMTPSGAIRLSEKLVRKADEIEELVNAKTK